MVKIDTAITELVKNYRYHHLTARTDKRYILLWVSNTHSQFKATPNGDGTDTIQGWKPIYQWQFAEDVTPQEFHSHFNAMVSIAQTGHLPQ